MIKRNRSLRSKATESTDYLNGITNASDVFASGLWALDYMHWWAAHNCSGVNFHNKSWLHTDTIYLDPSGKYQVYPKAYGIKALELGNHGQVEQLTMTNADRLNLTAYAIGDSNSLYVTVINKEHGVGPRDASVSIAPTGFAAASASAMFLTAPGGNVAATTGVLLGGASITNSGPWLGHWTALGPLSQGRSVLTVPAASAAIIKMDVVPTGPVIVWAGGNRLQLSWSFGVLQSATQLSGPYADVSGAVPPYAIVATNVQQFFRVRSE